MRLTAEQRIERRQARLKEARIKKDIMKEKVLSILPTCEKDAMTKIEISIKLTIPHQTITDIVKEIRQSRVPIIWTSKWIYIDYNSDALDRMNKKIERSKIGYERGMTNIQNIFADIIANWR